MSSWIGAFILVISFIFLLKLLRLVENSLKVISIAKESVQVMKDPALDDLQKEKSLQKHSIKLFSLFFIILISSVLALTLPLGLIWIFEQFDLLVLDNILEVALSWQFILASTVLAIVIVRIIKKKNDVL